LLQDIAFGGDSDFTDVGLSGELMYGPLNEDEEENPTGNSIARLQGT